MTDAQECGGTEEFFLKGGYSLSLQQRPVTEAGTARHELAPHEAGDIIDLRQQARPKELCCAL